MDLRRDRIDTPGLADKKPDVGRLSVEVMLREKPGWQISLFLILQSISGRLTSNCRHFLTARASEKTRREDDKVAAM